MERVLIQWNDILHVTANASEGKMKVGLGLGVGYLYRTKKNNSFSCIKLCKAPLHRVQTPMSSINTRVWQVVHYWVSSMCCSFLKKESSRLVKINSLYVDNQMNDNICKVLHDMILIQTYSSLVVCLLFKLSNFFLINHYKLRVHRL